MNRLKIMGTCSFKPEAKEVEMGKTDPNPANHKLGLITSIPVAVTGVGTVQITFWDDQALAVAVSGIMAGDLVRAEGELSATVYLTKQMKAALDCKLQNVTKLEYRKVGGLDDEGEENQSGWQLIALPERKKVEAKSGNIDFDKLTKESEAARQAAMAGGNGKKDREALAGTKK